MGSGGSKMEPDVDPPDPPQAQPQPPNSHIRRRPARPINIHPGSRIPPSPRRDEPETGHRNDRRGITGSPRIRVSVDSDPDPNPPPGPPSPIRPPPSPPCPPSPSPGPPPSPRKVTRRAERRERNSTSRSRPKRRRLVSGRSQSPASNGSNAATAGSSRESTAREMDALDDEYDDIFLRVDMDMESCSNETGSGGGLATIPFKPTGSFGASLSSRTGWDGGSSNTSSGGLSVGDARQRRNPSPTIPDRDPGHALVDDFDRFEITSFLYRRKEACNTINVAYQIRSSRCDRSYKLILRDLWAHMPILEVGAIVNLTGTSPDENNVYIVERDLGFLILDPDKLISVTSVVGMSWCERKIAFSEHFRFPIDTKDTLRGTLAHDLICQAMLKRRFLSQEITEEVNRLLKHPAILEKAYGLGLTSMELDLLGRGLVDYVLLIKDFMKPVGAGRKSGDRKLEILSVKDIEDCYWSPKFGLKGKVDCTVEAVNGLGEKFVIPMEFKTGRPQTKQVDVRSEHLGQVFLYSLMMGQTHLVGPNGILHYIREMHTVETSTKMNTLQSLVMARNRIILNLLSNNGSPGFEGLPRPMNVDFARHCNGCEYKNICALSLKEPTITEFPWTGTETKLRDSLSHLSQAEIDFFQKWLKIIKLEADEDALSYSAKNLWIHPIGKRESSGKCVGYLTITEQIVNPTDSSTLVKFSVPENRRQFLMNFAEKEFVIIGTLEESCVGFSFVEDIKEDSITVSFERPILGRHAEKTTKFVIDKISSQSAGSMQYVYLSQLMEDNPEAQRLRRRLILKDLPTHGKVSVSDLNASFRQVLAPFNKSQRVAIMQSVTTDSLLLVKGSPGCGKTTTIIGLIRVLVMQKKSVLVTAYTSNALDNILLAYKKFSNDFLRVGSSGKLNEALLNENCTNYLRDTVENVDELRELYDSRPVVGTTLLSVKHPIFINRKFDYCIVDEGSQALPTVIIGALLRADKWIIFGDPNQLPATIKSRKIKAMKIEDNLFTMLKEPEFSYNLTIQYRMNQVIMKIANHLMYENQMRCGSEQQAIQYLDFAKDDTMKYLTENYPWERMRNWLCVAVSRKPQRSVMFFNTECIGAFESPIASTLHNVKEKDIVMAILRLFVECNIPEEDIGIIAPYRGQVHLIQENVRRSFTGVEVNTVDQYQGREKRVIIVSFTKSVPHTEKDPPSEDSILNDMRRLNVAITRAKTKVILIGNSGCLNRYPACNKLLSLLQPVQKYPFTAADFYEGFFKDTAS